MTMSVSTHTTPRFGWSAKTPPQYEVRLTATDLTPGNSAVPTDAFVAQIADKMIGGDSTSRFAVIPNAKQILRSAETVREFQWNLSQKVFDRIKTRLMPADEATRYQAVPEFRDDVGSLSKLHYDGQSRLGDNKPGAPIPFFSLTYGDNQNIAGGYPVVADVRQYFKDKPVKLLDGLRDFLSGGKPKPQSQWEAPFPMGSPSPYFLQVGDNHAVEDHYALRLTDLDLKKDMSIVLLNNMFDGVFHAGGSVRKADESQPAKRPLGLVRFYDSGVPTNKKSTPEKLAQFIKGESGKLFG